MAMKEVSRSHIGTNLVEVVLEVIKDQEIQDNLGYFITDNVDNNDTMIRDITLSKLSFIIFNIRFLLIF